MASKVTDDRQRGGYQYFDDTLVVIHTTSMPRTDQEAFDLVPKIESWFSRPVRVRFIAARELNDYNYLFLPVEVKDGKVAATNAD